MTRQGLLIGVFSFAAVFGVAAGSDVTAGDYVWARTNWGSSNINARYGSMSNGYGGYYVPRDAYGNNYESQGNFTNPNGYIVPAAPLQQYVQQSQGPHLFGHRRKHWRH